MKHAAVLLAVLWSVTAGFLCASAGPPPQLRALSLNTLQSQLKNSLANGEPRPELLSLCGITRLSGYVEDRKHKDLILIGEVQDGAPALHTEDLALALRAAWMRYAVKQGRRLSYQNPGCSIDPDPAVIQRLKDLGDTDAPDSAAMQQQMQQWCDICSEPQSVRLLGIPFDTHFAKVMVDADYLMKRLVDGSVTLDIAGFASLTDITLALAKADFDKGVPSSVPGLSLNRFWFYPGKPEFLDREGLITLDACPVVLLTEEEHLTREGISGKGKPSPLAAQFARSFSAHYSDIAQKQTIYQELEGLFRGYALAKALRYQGTQADLNYLLDQFPVPTTRVDRTLPGMSRVSYFENRRDVPGGYEFRAFWLPTCGGVAMDFNLGPGNFRRAPARGRSSSRVGAAKPAPRPTPALGPRPPAPTTSQVLNARPSPSALFWDLPAAH